MSTAYDQLLDAAIHHLQQLKARGVRHVKVSPATLAALTQPAAPVRSSRPAPVASLEPVRPVAAATAAVSSPSPNVAPPPVPASPSAVRPTSKTEALAEVRRRALECGKCPHLAAARQHVVFGVGSPDADLMFVGEAPGADEDVQGEPFVGRAGQLLTRIIQTMGLSRDSVYIANILKCRPDTPGQSYGNRAPTEEEMETCIGWLLEQIDIIQPKVIVALGGTAVKGLLGVTPGITKLRGTWQTFRGIPVMPTFHPSFLLRPENAAKKRLVWEDMLRVMERLGLPISEKQKGYFLKAQG